MTTMPAHGTYARANGSPGYREPCKCGDCRKANRARRKRDEVNRQRGNPAMVPCTRAASRINTLLTGLSVMQISDAAGVAESTIREIADGTRTKIRRTTEAKILAVRNGRTRRGTFVDATATRRRLQALRALGWSGLILGEETGAGETPIKMICEGQRTVRAHLAERVATVYDKLSQTPAPHGISSAIARNHAMRKGWAPPAAWDDDSIGDPDAYPEWTGDCGTDRGYWVHRSRGIPMCQRCETAHEEWLAERADLTAQELNRARFAARAAAGTREAELAADARELASYGVSTADAADRLGVTLQHLQQVLLRHPAATDAEDAA